MYYGYVYRTTNILNNKTYIGQHKYNPNRAGRIYRGSGTILLKAIKKYGFNNFKVEELVWCKNKKELDKMEIIFIEEEKLKGKGEYNIASGGEGATGVSLYGSDNHFYGKHHSEETKKKISLSSKGRAGYWKGKSFTKEHVEKTRRTGTKHTQETKDKMSNTRSNPIRCDYCNKVLKNKGELVKHISFKHKEDRKKFGKTPNISKVEKQKGVRTKDGYRVKINGKYIGICTTLEEATKLRDDYRERKGLPKVVNRI